MKHLINSRTIYWFYVIIVITTYTMTTAKHCVAQEDKPKEPQLEYDVIDPPSSTTTYSIRQSMEIKELNEQLSDKFRFNIVWEFNVSFNTRNHARPFDYLHSGKSPSSIQSFWAFAQEPERKPLLNEITGRLVAIQKDKKKNRVYKIPVRADIAMSTIMHEKSATNEPTCEVASYFINVYINKAEIYRTENELIENPEDSQSLKDTIKKRFETCNDGSYRVYYKIYSDGRVRSMTTQDFYLEEYYQKESDEECPYSLKSIHVSKTIKEDPFSPEAPGVIVH